MRVYTCKSAFKFNSWVIQFHYLAIILTVVVYLVLKPSHPSVCFNGKSSESCRKKRGKGKRAPYHSSTIFPIITTSFLPSGFPYTCIYLNLQYPSLLMDALLHSAPMPVLMIRALQNCFILIILATVFFIMINEVVWCDKIHETRFGIFI